MIRFYHFTKTDAGSEFGGTLNYMYGLGIVWLVIFLVAPLTTEAVENAGIVDGIWLSDPQPVENQPVRVYVAIHNTTSGDLEGTVHFRVNDQLLDTMRINALSGRIIESWADWVPVAGTSTITVNLRRTELASNASGTQSVAVVQPLTERVIFIDTDTDGDGVGNQHDADDDNDGQTDEAERAAGTDPLVYDAPPEPAPAPTATENPTSATRVATSSATPARGLESVVEADAAQHTLARTTEFIQASKARLDAYREKRGATATGSSSTSTERAAAEQSALHAIGGAMYTGLLATLSWLLNYPALIQLLLLLLLLYLLYRVARYYGRR